MDCLTRGQKKDQALRKARDQFLFYAQQHEAKGTEDGAKKAQVNREMAAEMTKALEA